VTCQIWERHQFRWQDRREHKLLWAWAGCLQNRQRCPLVAHNTSGMLMNLFHCWWCVTVLMNCNKYYINYEGRSYCYWYSPWWGQCWCADGAYVQVGGSGTSGGAHADESSPCNTTPQAKEHARWLR
jgi:hypothetical protein